MICPQCLFANPAGAEKCSQCQAPLVGSQATLSDSGPAQPQIGTVNVGVVGASLQPGALLGKRYEILALLGEGGMGAVFKANDRELDRLVALKVIRPELAGHADILQRFKQELILARKVTHKNVNRIFDLGEADGIKFITMEFVDGHDLKALLRQRGKFPPAEAAEIVRQICRALVAAHGEGIVHRDLKPHNILVDKQGKVLVTDFGLAHSLEMSGLTQSGALLGTPEYMSPEQAKGEKVDHRSDLFSLGVIFYELLTGQTPYKADSAYATLLKRTQEASTPPAKLDRSIPKYLSDVVVKCLQIDPQRRYQNAVEILQDLEARQASRTLPAAGAWTQRLRAVAQTRRGMALLAVVGVLVLGALVGLRMTLWRTRTSPTGPSISLAILPFQNASGDPSLDWLGPGLADMLTTDVGQSRELRTVSSDRLHQILRDLRISPATTLDAPTLQHIAEFSSADVVVWGKYVQLGDQIRIDATLHDLKRREAIPLKAEAPSKSQLPEAVSALAKSIRDNLALSSDAREKLRASSFPPSTHSMEALRYYNEGLQLARQGNRLEATKKLEASIQADSSFALAYSKLAQTYASLGFSTEAEEFSRKAVELSSDLPPQEKYLIEANDAQITHDHKRAIEAYENLLRLLPQNSDVQFELARVYDEEGNFGQAREYYSKVLERDPKHVGALYGLSRVALEQNKPEEALDLLNRALSLAIQLDNREQKAKILHELGRAYLLLNKPEEAARYFQESLDIKREIGDKEGMAQSLRRLGQLHRRAGALDKAQAAYKEALKLQRDIGDRKGMANTLIDQGNLLVDRGQYDDALTTTKQALQLQAEVGDKLGQAACLNNIGGIYFLQGKYQDALTYYQQALQLRESLNLSSEVAVSLYNMAEAATYLGNYDEALAQYLRALEIWRKEGNHRRAALASYGMGLLFQQQGRYGAALEAMSEALQTYRQLGERGYWLGEILGGYGSSLALVGREEEAKKALDEGLELARNLGQEALTARLLNHQGDRLFYGGQFQAARPLYQEALRLASKVKDPQLVLTSKLNLAKLDLREGRPRAATGVFKEVAREAEKLSLKYVSTECSVYLAEALVDGKAYGQARQQINPALRAAEKMGLRALQARAHYALAEILRAEGKQTEANREFESALSLMQEMQQEARTPALDSREDLRPIKDAAHRFTKG